MLFTLVALGGYGCDGDDDARADATVDGGRLDGGGRDGGRDGGPRDGGPDGGPSDPGWTRLAGLPAGCNLEVAAYPERLGPLQWQPCFDGRSACEELVVDWGDWTTDRYITTALDRLYVGWGGEVYGLVRPSSDGWDWEALAVTPPGDVAFAWRYHAGGLCGLSGALAMNAMRVGFGTRIGSGLWPIDGVLSFGVPSRPTSMEQTITLTELTDGSFVQSMSFSEQGVVGVEIIPAYRVATIRGDVFRLTTSTGPANHPLAVGNTLLFDERRAGWSTVSKEDPDGTVSAYLAPPDTDVVNLRSDGEWLAWMEGRTHLTSSTHWATRTIKVARFAADPSALAPRTVLELGEGRIVDLRIGNGWLAVDRWEGALNAIVTVRLDTDAQRVVRGPPGYVFRGAPLYLSPDEMAIVISQETTLIDRTIWRVPLSP